MMETYFQISLRSTGSTWLRNRHGMRPKAGNLECVVVKRPLLRSVHNSGQPRIGVAAITLPSRIVATRRPRPIAGMRANSAKSRVMHGCQAVTYLSRPVSHALITAEWHKGCSSVIRKPAKEARRNRWKSTM
jgi:hypothetical protein